LRSALGASVRPVVKRREVWFARRCALRVLAFILIFAGSWATTPQRAHANPDLDRAIRLSGELEFQSALRAFQKALDSNSLTKAELTKLLAERALLLHGLRRQPEVVSDFRWLAAVDPGHQLDRRAPPDLTAVWESVRREVGGASSVELRDESAPGLLRLRPLVKGARPEGLHIEAFFRTADGPFEPIDEATGVERELPQGAEVQGYATLTGLGQVTLSSAGSAENPLRFQVPAAGAEPVAYATGGADAPARIERKWLWIGGAVAVVAVGVITAVVLADRGEDSRDVKLKTIATF
jgi:hypothetical protein